MVIAKKPLSISFEFFPPKTPAGMRKLANEREALAALAPEFFSVTYGAGGSTRAFTREVVLNIQNQTAISTAPHLSCIGEPKAALVELIRAYQAEGVRRVVALRGDLPENFDPSQCELYYAVDLVKLIRDTTGDHFFIEVAAYPEVHPQAQNMATDLAFFKAKVDAGANGAITQYFYNADAYEHFLNGCETMGIGIPIVPGIMPITNRDGLVRFSKMCGAEIPRWIMKQLQAYDHDTHAVVQFGEEVVTRLVERLIGLGAPGFHFYTLNQAGPSIAVCKNLGLSRAA